MHLQKIPFRNTHAFNEFFLKYIDQDSSLRPFYSRFPTEENFKEQIAEKSSFPESTRKTLVDTITKQYSKLSHPPPVKQNIQSLLNPKTFTVVTGHQQNIFTGPLYFIYKIVTTINACRKLKTRYPEFHFVPVYWMASEDHDYEEIKSFRLYGKKYTWETNQKGAVGKFNLKEFAGLLKEIPGDIDLFREAYTKNDTLSEAVRHYVNRLFGEEGLVVVDADDAALKNIFKPVIHADVIDHTPFKLVEETNSRLQSAGFHPAVNPREINFFFLDRNLRSRLEQAGDGFAVVDTQLLFSKDQLLKMISNEPVKFSPNVILRPLYQEMILPNLAYVGGPAEVVYWLELKAMFQHFNIPFPILLPRNFALVVDTQSGRKLSRTGLDLQEFFEEKNYLFNHWVTRNSSHDLSLGEAMKTLSALAADIRDRSEKIDSTLGPMVSAETKRMQNVLEKIEKKMLRAEKRLQSDRLRQIEAVRDELFPNGALQERTDNFLNFYQKDHEFIHKLIEHLDPFDFQFHALSYQHE
jgi:bacillithiol biosynthesis cysteine-adding enzyme BshC